MKEELQLELEDNYYDKIWDDRTANTRIELLSAGVERDKENKEISINFQQVLTYLETIESLKPQAPILQVQVGSIKSESTIKKKYYTHRLNDLLEVVESKLNSIDEPEIPKKTTERIPFSSVC